jgi:hypothetical protein
MSRGLGFSPLHRVTGFLAFLISVKERHNGNFGQPARLGLEFSGLQGFGFSGLKVFRLSWFWDYRLRDSARSRPGLDEAAVLVFEL